MKSSLSDEHRDVLDGIMTEAIGGNEKIRTADLGNRVREALRTAEADGHPWAGELLGHILHGACANWGKRWRNAHKPTVMIDYAGDQVEAPSERGRQVRDEQGRTYWERAQLALFTWDDLEDLRASAMTRRRAAEVDLAMLRRLDELHAAEPDSVSPEDAARRQGVTLDQVLNGSWEAA